MSLFIRIFLLTTLLINCNHVESNSYQPMPSSTIPVVEWIEDCEDHYIAVNNSIIHNYGRCLELGTPFEECGRMREEESSFNWDMRTDCWKHLPQVDTRCSAQLDPLSPTQDTDGDGVTDYFEYRMALNPCEKCSYGGTPGVDCDGDLDWDKDGVPNAEDYHPICGWIWLEGQEYQFSDNVMSWNCV